MDDLQADYAETMALLVEACDFLARLQPHPMTADLVRKVRAHVAAPGFRVEVERERLAGLRTWGVNFTQRGIPVLEAAVQGQLLTVSAPALKKRGGEAFERLILDRLRRGEVIALGYRNAEGDWENPGMPGKGGSRSFGTALQDHYLGTRATLDDVLDYLGRLPVAVETARMISRIQAHIDAPSHQVQLERQQLFAARLAGATLNEQGTPVLAAELLGSLVRVHAPMLNTSDGERFGRVLADRLKVGEAIELRRAEGTGGWRPPAFYP